MEKTKEMTIEETKESICKFYLDNKEECDLYYFNAEKTELGEFYEDVINVNKIRNLFLEVGIVILTANKYEKNILHQEIYSSQRKKIKRIEISLFPCQESRGETYAYWFKWKDYVILHIEAQKMGSYTVGGSADITRYIINHPYLFPLGIISFGICFGTNENKYQLGDVVISKKVYPYFMGAKITESGYFVDDDNMFRINERLRAKIKVIIEKNSFLNLKQDVFCGNYITGEAVISRKKARDEFVRITTQEVLAGEMEGYGLFKECKASEYSMPCLIVKSICDWAVVKNFDAKNVFNNLNINSFEKEIITTIKDRLQAYAAHQAFLVLEILFSNNIFENSIYKNLIQELKNINEAGIYARYIKEFVQKLIKEHTLCAQIPNEFIISIIRKLLDDEWITTDCSDLEKNVKKTNEMIWNYFLALNKENKNVKN